MFAFSLDYATVRKLTKKRAFRPNHESCEITYCFQVCYQQQNNRNLTRYTTFQEPRKPASIILCQVDNYKVIYLC